MRPRPVSEFVFAFALLATTAAAAPPDLASHRWRQLSVAAPTPPPRRDAALGFDRARARLILFGGKQGSTNYADTWALDLANGTWSELAPAPAIRPPGRFSMVAGVDEARDRFLITTGEDVGTGNFFNDVWSLDLTTHRWAQVATTGGPPAARYGSAGGIFSAAGAAAGTSLFVSHGFTNSGRFDDTWTLDLASDTWSEVTPAPPLPVKRCLHTACLLAPGQLALFGGCASGFGPCPLGDLWLFEAASGWRNSGLTGPSARLHPTLVAIADTGAAVLFGGQASANTNDLWLFDPAVPTWVALSPGTPLPPARSGHSAVWVDNSAGDTCGRLFVFGGSGAGGDRNDTWILERPSNLPDPTLLAIGGTNAVELSWLHDPAAVRYEVWRHTIADFQPGDPGAVRLAGPVTISGPDASLRDDPLPDPTVDYYYRIRAFACP